MSAGVLAGRRSALACSAGEARIRRPQPERKSGIGADPARARQQLAKGRAQVWRGASEALSKSVTSKNPTLSKAPLDLLGETKLLNLRHLQIGPTERNTTVFLSPLFSTTFNATLVGKRHESTKNLSSVTSDFSLANMAWLKAPMESLSIPVTQLLAFSYAALRPSELLLEKYMIEIDKLLSDSQISERDHQIIRSSPEVYKELIYLTIGKDVSLSHETITDLLGQVSREIKNEELAKLEADKISHRSTRDALTSEKKLNRQLIDSLYWRCVRNATMIARASEFSTGVLLLEGLYAAPVMELPKSVTAIIFLSESVLFVWTTINLWFGVSIKHGPLNFEVQR